MIVRLLEGWFLFLTLDWALSGHKLEWVFLVLWDRSQHLVVTNFGRM